MGIAQDIDPPNNCLVSHPSGRATERGIFTNVPPGVINIGPAYENSSGFLQSQGQGQYISPKPSVFAQQMSLKRTSVSVSTNTPAAVSVSTNAWNDGLTSPLLMAVFRVTGGVHNCVRQECHRRWSRGHNHTRGHPVTPE